MASLRQIRANVENARNSTGPASTAGKAASRRNALKHGLAGTGVVLPEDDAEESRERAAQLVSSLRPDNAWEIWLTERIGVLLVRIERCEAQDAILRQLQANRAGTLWDDDRRLAAEELGALLPRSPAVVARRLGGTPQGCDWLIGRWEALAGRLESGPWDDDGRRQALDLLGVAAECRRGPSAPDPAPGQDPAEAQRSLAAGEVARLRALKADVLDDADRDEQLAAELGQEPEPDAARRHLRRYQQAAARELAWCRSQFKSSMRPYRPNDSDPSRNSRPYLPAASAPYPEPAPPPLTPLTPAPAPAPARDEVAARPAPELPGRPAGPEWGRALALGDALAAPAPNRQARRATAARAHQAG